MDRGVWHFLLSRGASRFISDRLLVASVVGIYCGVRYRPRTYTFAKNVCAADSIVWPSSYVAGGHFLCSLMSRSRNCYHRGAKTDSKYDFLPKDLNYD